MKKYVLQTLVPFCYYIGIGFFNTAMAFDAPPYAITHQLTHTFELKPISSDSYQISKATFLPDYVENGFSGNKLDDDYNGMEGDCKNIDNLYTTKNCTYPKAVVAASLCPFLPGHYTRCECLPQFKITSCNTPYIFGGDNCDGKYEKCVCPATVSLVYANDECISYCEGNCIDKRCIPSADQKNCTNSTEPCDDGCGGTSRRCCIPCSDKITSKPDNSSYTYSSCTDGNGTHQIQTGWTCNSGYHEKNGACEKDCIANNCSGYSLTSCPDNATCSECKKETTTCGGGDTMYKKTGCASGYHEKDGNCVADCQANDCSGYSLGSCPDKGNCSSCTKETTTCAGGGTVYKLDSCASGYRVSGNSCVIGYEKCTVGKILFSDGTCLSQKDGSKSITGIVLSRNPNLVMSVERTSSDFGAGQAGITWSYISGLADLSASEAANDFNGKNNTNLYKQHSDKTGFQYRPINNALNYSSGSIGKGSWFIPAGGQAKLFGANKTELNKGLSAISSSSVINDSDTYWTTSSVIYRGANPPTQNHYVYKVKENKISSYSGGHTHYSRYIAEFTPAPECE